MIKRSFLKNYLHNRLLASWLLVWRWNKIEHLHIFSDITLVWAHSSRSPASMLVHRQEPPQNIRVLANVCSELQANGKPFGNVRERLPLFANLSTWVGCALTNWSDLSDLSNIMICYTLNRLANVIIIVIDNGVRIWRSGLGCWNLPTVYWDYCLLVIFVFPAVN